MDMQVKRSHDKKRLFLELRFKEVEDVDKEQPGDILPNRALLEITRETIPVQLEGENAPRPVRKLAPLQS